MCFHYVSSWLSWLVHDGPWKMDRLLCVVDGETKVFPEVRSYVAGL